MFDYKVLLADMAWPMTILIAWIAGEYAHSRGKLPRISIYALIGFIAAPSQTGFLPATQASGLLLLANISFGLILFECGYRINLRWLRANPWLTVTGFVEAVLTFAAVYLILAWYGQPSSNSFLIAALSMATSPATIIRVINEQRSSGQVTERILHLSALNCVAAVFVFKVIVGLEIFRTSGNLWDAVNSSFIVIATSVLLGISFGVAISALLRFTRRTTHDSTLAFIIAVVCLVFLAHSLKLSPILAALTLGLSARHRRISLSPSQRGFGTIGDLLSILLFVFIASRLELQQVLAGVGLGLAIITFRLIAKTIGIGLLSHTSGISWRKGLLIGVAMTPISAFVILVLEQTRYLGIDLVDQLAPLAAAALILELFGPIFVQRALILAGEAIETKES